MNKEQFQSLHAELKELAHMIKVMRHNERAYQSQTFGAKKIKPIPEPKWTITLFSLLRARYEYRHKHIILSLARGKTREQIETPKEGNLPNEKYITSLLEQYADIETPVCIGS